MSLTDEEKVAINGLLYLWNTKFKAFGIDSPFACIKKDDKYLFTFRIPELGINVQKELIKDK